MTKQDLKTGMIIELRNGNKYLVMLNSDRKDMELINVKGGFLPLRSYDMEMLYCGDASFDIMKVYSLKTLSRLFCNTVESNIDHMVWKREESRKMTKKEIEEELGFKIEIVEER